MEKKLNILLLLNIILIVSCCIAPPQIPEPVTANDSTTQATTIITAPQIILVNKTIHPTPENPWPLENAEYLKAGSSSITSHAQEITQACSSDECKVLRIHKYAIENFYYQDYKNETPGMGLLFNDGCGEDRNFAAYYHNYLGALGVETRLAVISGLPYTLACGIDLDILQSQIEDDPDFKEYVQNTLFPSFEFETHELSGKTCLRLDSATKTLGTYMYPGQHRTMSNWENSYYVDPEKDEWVKIDMSKVENVSRKAHFKRTYNFSLGTESTITWKLAMVEEEKDWPVYEYRFDAYDIQGGVQREYATFTLPERSRFDRAKMRIEIDASEPFIFFTLENEEEVAGLDYIMQNQDPDKTRIELERVGQLPWEFDYLRSCSQETPAENFTKECIIPDAGRRAFAIYNYKRLAENQVNVTIEYLEFL